MSGHDWEFLRDPYRIFLDHAIRRWEAGEENSRRIGARVGLLVTASFGFFGVVLLRFGLARWQIPSTLPHEGKTLYAAMILLFLGLLLLAVACLFLFDLFRWRRQSEPASQHLRLPERDQEAIRRTLEYLLEDETPDPRRFHSLAMLQMVQQADAYDRATSDLRIRNAREKKRIDWAQRFFLPGIACIMLALALWVYTGVVTSGAAANRTEESRNANHETTTARQDPGETGEGLGSDDDRGETRADGPVDGSDAEPRPNE